MNAMMMIQEERARQIFEEGFTLARDDKYAGGELSKAAICYQYDGLPEQRLESEWPWPRSWWKPGTRVRNLIRAGALFVAEHDRVRRVNAREQPQLVVWAGSRGARYVGNKWACRDVIEQCIQRCADELQAEVDRGDLRAAPGA